MTPGICYKLDVFINEVLGDNILMAQRDKTVQNLTQLALQGDCQFNCRCSEWNRCPMAVQTRPRPCSKFFTAPSTDSYQSAKSNPL